MATTTNYGWTKPTVGADADAWGGYLNTTIDSIDSTVFGMLPKAGGTMTGALLASVGAVGTPSLSFTGDTDTGLYHPAANSVSIVTNGATVAAFTAAATALTGTLSVSGVLTATGGVVGNASTATALATGRTLSISGDLTYTSPSFDGSGNVTAAGTLATVNSNTGSWGSGTSVATFTVNGKGLITAASNTAITSAPKWTTARTLSLTGPVTGSVSLDGSANASIATTIAGPYCQARAVFSVSGGVCTLIDGYNVSGVSYTAAGRYTVSFTSNLTSSYYVPAGVVIKPSSPNALILAADAVTGQSASACGIAVYRNDAVLADPTMVYVTFTG